MSAGQRRLRPGPAGSAAGLAAGLVVLVAGGATLATQPPPALALWAGLAALAALGLALWRYELLVAVAFFALGGVRFDPAPVDAVIAVLVAVALVTGRIDLRRVPAPALVLVGVLLAVNLVSGVAVDDIPLAAQYFSITLYLAVFAVWLCSYLAAQRRVRLVVGAYVAGAAVSALLGTLALVAAIPGLPADLFVAYGTRATGLFQDPNVFGPFLVPAALIMLEETLIPRLLRLGRPLSAVLFAVLTIGVLLSYSRAAWLNLVVGVFVMVVFYALRGGGRTLSRMLVALAIAASVLATALAMTGGFAFLEERAQLQAYDAERFGGQDQALATAEAHPLGVGPGQLELTQTQLPHNVYVLVLAEQGVAGLVVLLALFGVTLWMALVAAARRGHVHGLGTAAVLAAWCGLLINSLVIDTLHWRHLWFVAALAWVAWLTTHRSGRSGPAGSAS